jgi:hypothetical protein
MSAMPGAKQRDLAKEGRWRRLLEQWRDGGLSVRAFCRRHDVAEARAAQDGKLLAEREVLGRQRPSAVEKPAQKEPDQRHGVHFGHCRRDGPTG